MVTKLCFFFISGKCLVVGKAEMQNLLLTWDKMWGYLWVSGCSPQSYSFPVRRAMLRQWSQVLLPTLLCKVLWRSTNEGKNSGLLLTPQMREPGLCFRSADHMGLEEEGGGLASWSRQWNRWNCAFPPPLNLNSPIHFYMAQETWNFDQ